LEPIRLLLTRFLSRFDVWPVAIAVSVLASGVVPLRAQSLADVARQEEARRKEIRQPAKVYTNKDLVSVPSTSPQTAASTAPAVPDAAGKAAKDATGDAAKDAKDTKDPAGVKDQAYWSNRLKTLTAQLDNDQMLADAQRNRVNTLTAAAVTGPDMQKALDDLDRLMQAVERDRKAVADFPEEARRASVPPGWLR
jgi:hypothetical protein